MKLKAFVLVFVLLALAAQALSQIPLWQRFDTGSPTIYPQADSSLLLVYSDHLLLRNPVGTIVWQQSSANPIKGVSGPGALGDYYLTTLDAQGVTHLVDIDAQGTAVWDHSFATLSSFHFDSVGNVFV
jgi:hypothetical protein